MSAPATSPLPYFILGFLVFLYLPHIFFKLGAEKWLDLGRKKDSSQIEEFLSVALPSATLNLIACCFIFLPRIVLRLVTLVINWISGMFSETFWSFLNSYSLWTPGAIDWPALSSLVGSGGANSGLAAYVGRGEWWGEVAYVMWLYLVAIVNGRAYGRIVRARVTRGATREHLVRDILSKMTGAEQFRWLIGGLFYKLWDPFYHEFHVSMFTWMARSTPVWLRTTDEHLFFGTFYRYEKTNTGELAGVTLANVHRYKHDAKPAIISTFEGYLFVPAAQIADINLTTLDSLKRLRLRLQKRAKQEKSDQLTHELEDPFPTS